jgi:hypothetical protein
MKIINNAGDHGPENALDSCLPVPHIHRDWALNLEVDPFWKKPSWVTLADLGRMRRGQDFRGHPPQSADQVSGLIEAAYGHMLNGNVEAALHTLDVIWRSRSPADHVQTVLHDVGAPGKHRLLDKRCGETQQASIVVRTLGCFELIVRGRAFSAPHKQPVRTLTLLKAIIAFGGVRVNRSVLADTLWPDFDGDHASNALCVTLHRLRELLGNSEAVEMKEGRLSLNRAIMSVDALELDALSKDGGVNILDKAQNVFDIYQGPFLPEDSESPWTAKMRERARNTFVRLIVGVGARLENAEKFEEAEALYQRALNQDDGARGLVPALSRCRHRTWEDEARNARHRPSVNHIQPWCR